MLYVPVGEHSLLLDLAEHLEQRRLHPVTVERVLPRLRLVQSLVGDAQDLVEELGDVSGLVGGSEEGVLLMCVASGMAVG